ncbi:EscU/YscU/HrcU family type III secretion system export apparatus switch protein [Vulgatibacter incomptus]|uniref:Flagellar biosynthesis protein FlhB n=1 Tax=Vulgatibacter incomptus TaxID=1391653 RepID=A0A0K1PHL3_9BACT|nr:EscU/YscU/HrcU family type III secretion system export apparatus switch protein [Vulgatibacter incomptus]AKU93010.1 Flagellar biosynthesis protein FlhB [Vulgatibacter incomptus]
MSDESSKDDKTEQASQKRLQHAADKGQIALSKDAVTVASLGAALVALSFAAIPLRDALIELFGASVRAAPEGRPSALLGLLARPTLLALVPCLAGAAGGLAATVVQTRARMWPHLAAPDPERLWQAGKLKRLFSREVVSDLGLAAVKVLAILGTVWLSVRDDALGLGSLPTATPAAQLSHFSSLIASAGVRVLTVMVALAGVDFAVTRYRFGAKMRMTREELKREHKEDEGDPLIRSQRRRRQRELARVRVSVEVPRADAVLVNPTHVAVAIRYRRDEARAPRVIAKGKGQLAEIMRELARSNGIPIVEDIPLARLLYRRVKVGREIPAETYKAVATILAFVYRITGRPGAARAA